MADRIHYRCVNGGRLVAKCGADVPATSLVHLAVRSTCVDCLTRARDDAEDVMRDAQEHYASIVDTLFRLSLANLGKQMSESRKVPRG